MKNKIILSSMIAISLAITAAAQTATNDHGAVINGVTWATRNVDAVGRFAEYPESAGSFYQWNRKVAWAAEGAVIGWDNSIPEGTEWTDENDPSPDGFRVPTQAEVNSLLDPTKVSNVWTQQNGIDGQLFTDLENGNTLFLPTAGHRDASDGTVGNIGVFGNYWCSEQYNDGTEDVYYFTFGQGICDDFASDISGNYGLSVRSVKKSQGTGINEITKEELRIVIENGELKIENYAGGAVAIYDIAGRIVGARFIAPANNGAQTIDISQLPAGVYIVRAGNKTGKFAKR